MNVNNFINGKFFIEKKNETENETGRTIKTCDISSFIREFNKEFSKDDKNVGSVLVISKKWDEIIPNLIYIENQVIFDENKHNILVENSYPKAIKKVRRKFISKEKNLPPNEEKKFDRVLVIGRNNKAQMLLGMMQNDNISTLEQAIIGNINAIFKRVEINQVMWVS